MKKLRKAMGAFVAFLFFLLVSFNIGAEPVPTFSVT